MKSSANKPWSVDTKFKGTMTEQSVAVVMNNSIDRNQTNKKKISYFITENINLLAGLNTVAVFKFKKEEKVLENVVEEVPVEKSLNSTNLFVSYLNKRSGASGGSSAQ